MKNCSKLFPFTLTLAVLPLAGCYHYNHNPAAELANNKASIQQWVADASSSFDASSKATLDKINQLIPQDPAKASALVGDLPDNGVANMTVGQGPFPIRKPAEIAKDAGIMIVAESWFAKDPHAAADWLNTLPPGDPRDHGVEMILPDAVSRDPSTALGLANIISNPFGRANSLEGVVALWAKTDPAAATAAVQSAKLTDITWVMSTAEQERANLLRAIHEASPPAK